MTYCTVSFALSSLIVRDDVTHHGSSKVNSDVSRGLFFFFYITKKQKVSSNQLKRKTAHLLGTLHFQQNNGPKHTAQNANKFIKHKEVDDFTLPKSIPRHKPHRNCILPVYLWQVTRAPTDTTSERGSDKIPQEHHKRRMQKFGSSNGPFYFKSYLL